MSASYLNHSNFKKKKLEENSTLMLPYPGIMLGTRPEG